MLYNTLFRAIAVLFLLTATISKPLRNPKGIDAIDAPAYARRQATRSTVVEREQIRASRPQRRQQASVRSFPNANPMPVAQTRYARFVNWDNGNNDIRVYNNVPSENTCIAYCDNWTGSGTCVGAHWNLGRTCYLKGSTVNLRYGYINPPGGGVTLMKGTCADWDAMAAPPQGMKNDCQEVRPSPP